MKWATLRFLRNLHNIEIEIQDFSQDFWNINFFISIWKTIKLISWSTFQVILGPKQSVENDIFTVTWKIFVKIVLNALVSWYFCWKLANLWTFQTTGWKLRKFSLTFFDKKFVKTTVLLKKLLKNWFHEIFFQWENLSFFQSVQTNIAL